MKLFYMGRHEAEPKSKGRRRAGTLISAALSFMLVLGSVALADQITNTIDSTIDPALETVTITAGGSATVGFKVIASNAIPSGDASGCNATGASPAIASFSIPTGVAATPSPVTFVGCGTEHDVVFSSSTPGEYTIAIASVSGGKMGSRWDLAPASFTLVVNPAAPTDSTAPTAAPTQSPAANGDGWNNTDVAVNWNWADNTGGSGIDTANCTTSSTSTGEGTITLSATCKDLAGNTGNATYDVKVDKTKPNLDPSVSPDPVIVGVSATVAAMASDPGGSGIASVSCDPVDTSTVGAHTVSCTATDRAGNSNTRSASYQVIYNFSGFFRPVDNLPYMNVVRAGSAIPVKFSLSGNQGLNIFAAGYPKAVTTSCGGTADPIEETVTAGNSSLSYDPVTDQYNYVWKTTKSWTGCRQLQVMLVDGQMYTANFSFK